MTLNDFARGRVVYGNGSFAPNRGPVSPSGAMGYLQREISKPRAPRMPPVGADGQSDSRSGLAAQMINRGNKNKGGLQSTIHNPGGNKGGKPNAPQHPTHPLDPRHDLGVTPGAPAEPTIPTVKINENGTLDLPYNDEWSQAVLEAFQSMNSELLGLNAESQQQAAQFSLQNRDLDQQYGDMRRGTLNDNASRGTAFSSGYGMGVVNDARMYNNTKNDLNIQNSQFMQNTQLQQLAIQNAFNEMIRQNILQQAQQEAADEGHEAPVTPETQPHKNKHKHHKGPKKGHKK